MHSIRRLFAAVTIIFLLLFRVQGVYAAISSCAVSVSPSSIGTSSTGTFTFSVTNQSPESIAWVKVNAPASGITITGGSASGWSADAQSSYVLFNGSTIAENSSASFSVEVQSGSDQVSSSWSLQASDDSDGFDAIGCSGSLSISVSNAATISNIVVSDISDTQAKISWTTDESGTTVVDYGTDDGYGSSATGDAGTSHSVTINSLTANTTYHYNVISADAAGNTGESGDNTFTTAKQGTTVTTIVTGTVSTTTTSVRATPTPVPDTTGPYVVIASKFDKPFTQAPAIKGTATDKSLVASIEYSIDDGHNWLPVDFIDKPNTTRTDFTFTPQLMDGNYDLKIRAKDGKGNASITDGGTLIVDRLPPRIGGVVFSLGPQELVPEANGAYIVPAGLDYKITLSAVGGPLLIDISVKEKGESQQVTRLKKNPDNGLWSGYLRFENPGDFTISVDSIDGADNVLHQDLAFVTVLASGAVLDGTSAIGNGQIAVYYLDDATKRFVLWDGSGYGQLNPQPFTPVGGYRLYIPAGTYYLRVNAPGFKALVSSIFTLKSAYPIVSNFTLVHARALRIGPWLIPLPDFTQTTTDITLTIPSAATTGMASPIVDREFPYFRLVTDGAEVTSLLLRGKPTIVTILNTWLPQASAQLAVLDELVKKKEINVVVLVPQESASSVSIFKKRAGHTVMVVADPDGDLIEPLGIHTLPTHIVVNRKGIVQSIQTGVFNKEELLDMLIK